MDMLLLRAMFHACVAKRRWFGASWREPHTSPLMAVDLRQHRGWHHGPWLCGLLGEALIYHVAAFARPFQFLVLYQVTIIMALVLGQGFLSMQQELGAPYRHICYCP